MDLGDLLFDNHGTNMLWVVISISHQYGEFTARQLTDDAKNILDDTYPAVTSGILALVSTRFMQIAWGDQTCQFIMQQRPFPHWVHMAISPTLSTMATQAHQGPPQTQGATGYPIGTLFLGTGKAGHVYIVNKDNSRDISRLWNGKTGLWCTSELEYTDNLIPGPHKSKTSQEVCDEINAKMGCVFTPANFPKWAKHMILTPHKTLPVKPAQTMGSLGYKPAVGKLLTKANILQQKEESNKKVAKAEDSCNHIFIPYVGIREVYEFCSKCDFKVRGKQ